MTLIEPSRHCPLTRDEAALADTPVINWRHGILSVATTRCTEFVDLTDRLDALIGSFGFETGIANVQTLHTTTGILVNENEPLLLADFAATLEFAAPAGLAYRHDDFRVRTVNLTADERVNGHAHCKAMLLRAAECLNVAGGRLRLGQWQRVFLVELDGPRMRDVSVVIAGEKAGRTRQ
jgi:secondary thiamine-phosphate synthase enzyme